MKPKLVVLVVALVLLVVGGGIGAVVALTRNADPEVEKTAPTPAPSASTTAPTVADYPEARSTPLEDSVYPNVGDPGVDALHYDLDLAWDPETRMLEATAEVIFRATGSAEQFQLDLGEPLEVTSVTLDGEEVESEHNGKDFVVKAPVLVDSRHELVVEYQGTPEPVTAPSTRTDFETLGFTVNDDSQVWTMQEPYGAFTWYPVNDQPSDKAFYDFTISVPSPWVGIANGTLTSRTEVEGDTVTEFHLDAPASSYLVTLAIGDYDHVQDKTASGVPLNFWAPRGDTNALKSLRFTKVALKWLEEKLGPYPFASAGGVVVDAQSAMETQTLVTYGNNPYALSPEVVMHELTHQWYGDLVSPTDWRDVWMNEGMTMYLQLVFEAERAARDIDEVIEGYVPGEAAGREVAGPPGNYDPRMFGEGNIYVSPALMWHELRQRIGDDDFWAMVKKWPRVHANGNATRKQYFDWIEKETDLELTSFLDAWIMGETSPPTS